MKRSICLQHLRASVGWPMAELLLYRLEWGRLPNPIEDGPRPGGAFCAAASGADYISFVTKTSSPSMSMILTATVVGSSGASSS